MDSIANNRNDSNEAIDASSTTISVHESFDFLPFSTPLNPFEESNFSINPFTAAHAGVGEVIFDPCKDLEDVNLLTGIMSSSSEHTVDNRDKNTNQRALYDYASRIPGGSSGDEFVESRDVLLSRSSPLSHPSSTYGDDDAVDARAEYQPLQDIFGEFIGPDDEGDILINDSGFGESKYDVDRFDPWQGTVPSDEVESDPSSTDNTEPRELKRFCIEPLTQEKIRSIQSIMKKISLKPRPQLDLFASSLSSSHLRLGDELQKSQTDA